MILVFYGADPQYVSSINCAPVSSVYRKHLIGIEKYCAQWSLIPQIIMDIWKTYV